jgi:FKBP-type peptidyl-prolyl cis-trans isomerase 2
MMTHVEQGDTVHLHYTGTLQDGTTFDSSEGREPLVFQVGTGQIIPGLDTALPGMAVGDEKTVDIPCDQAYGPVNPGMQQQVPRADIPPNIPVDVGTQLQMKTPDGQAVPVIVTAADAESVTLDANHPLAGKDLKFEIKLVSIQKAA